MDSEAIVSKYRTFVELPSQVGNETKDTKVDRSRNKACQEDEELRQAMYVIDARIQKAEDLSGGRDTRFWKQPEFYTRLNLVRSYLDGRND